MRSGNFRVAVIVFATKKRRNWLTLALMRWTGEAEELGSARLRQ